VHRVQGNVKVQGMGIFFLVMPLAQTPGPDLACQDAVMESEAFVSSEDSWISTSRRARAGWHAKHQYKELTYEIL